MRVTACKVKGQGPERQAWTTRCLDCPWVSQVTSYRSGQQWAKYHRTHTGHHTVVRKGTEEETRDAK